MAQASVGNAGGLSIAAHVTHLQLRSIVWLGRQQEGAALTAGHL